MVLCPQLIHTTLTHFFRDGSLVSDQAKANAHKSFSFFPSFIFPDCVDWVGYRDCTLLVTYSKIWKKNHYPQIQNLYYSHFISKVMYHFIKTNSVLSGARWWRWVKINEEINSTKKLACCKIVLLDISMFSHIYHVFWSIHIHCNMYSGKWNTRKKCKIYKYLK